MSHGWVCNFGYSQNGCYAVAGPPTMRGFECWCRPRVLADRELNFTVDISLGSSKALTRYPVKTPPSRRGIA